MKSAAFFVGKGLEFSVIRCRLYGKKKFDLRRSLSFLYNSQMITPHGG